MESINLSKRKFNKLKELDLGEDVVSTEATFYKFNHLGKVKVFKRLNKTNGPVFANKLFTLEMLHEYREILPESFVIPEALVSVENEVFQLNIPDINGVSAETFINTRANQKRIKTKNIQGFDLPFIDGITLESFLKNSKVKKKMQIKYLKEIGKILDQLHHIRENTELKSIYLNDLHASNFMIDKKSLDLKVVDLDSCRICDSKPFPARHLTPFSLLTQAPANKYDIYKKEMIDEDGSIVLQMVSDDDYGKAYCTYKNYKDELGFINSNEQSDLYCYIILILEYLYGPNIDFISLEKFYDYMNYLEKLDFDRELINGIIQIVTGAPNVNIAPYLDTLTPKQIHLANKTKFEEFRSSGIVK